ncbi:hypothetical protein MKX01_028173 [Papaver californicum]|nr:hypothetical protein MKX01_028173 [Papaver californicum]
MALSSASTIEEPLTVNNQTVLQKHASFFDRNKDRMSIVAAVLINIGLSGKTRPGKFPNLLFPIEIKNITRAKRKADTGIYDDQGNFDAAKFEEVCLKHSNTGTSFTKDELLGMLKPRTALRDYPEWYGGWLGWRNFYTVCKDKDGLVQKETLRAFYTGDGLFEKIEQERTARK